MNEEEYAQAKAIVEAVAAAVGEAAITTDPPAFAAARLKNTLEEATDDIEALADTLNQRLIERVTQLEAQLHRAASVLQQRAPLAARRAMAGYIWETIR